MIQPANIEFQGVVGGTFDTQITLYQGNLQYVWFGVWQPFRDYPVNAMVAGSDSKVYVSLAAVLPNVNPVGDGGVHWAQLTPLNLTGWTGTCTINHALTAVTTMGGALGTVSANFSGTQMGTLAVGTYDLNIEVIDASSNNYFPVIGSIVLVSP